MVDLVTAAALLLLVAGVVGSVVPLVPAGPLSAAGVIVYYVLAPPSAPALGVGWLVLFVLVGLIAFAVEHLGGAIASKVGGAETTTMVIAGVASLALLFVLGPLGIVVGTGLAVFGAELYAGKEPAAAARAAGYTLAGLLASSVAQLALTLSILAGFVAVVFLL
ncbi:DUF456 domain-containing protein [Halobaculum rubrum]|uniref:DUF456 domain-containing protein n=1 Tax=Halobaculum rubrum TaxID=2872158 RepID=UPI001CA3A937|nr:DUF456 domain-containing protein [Halobaculum rubrum]QZX99566.1 DUF456 family protein [Halobaculum rubrum]